MSYPSESPRPVPEEVVRAALRASRDRGVPVADVPLIAVAQEAGISRSTLLRRLGGTRQALDEAVRATGVDPGERHSVRERAVTAAAELISRHGLASATLERVADSAGCSVPSLYATFGGRDHLLQAVYERYSPVLDIESVLEGPRDDLAGTVRAVHRLVREGLDREPRVVPALLADSLARPSDPAVQAVRQHALLRLMDSIGRWLSMEIAAGRIRDLPPLLLAQQMVGPLLLHHIQAPAAAHLGTAGSAGSEEAVQVFTEAFLRAAALPRSG